MSDFQDINKALRMQIQQVLNIDIHKPLSIEMRNQIAESQYKLLEISNTAIEAFEMLEAILKYQASLAHSNKTLTSEQKEKLVKYGVRKP